MEVITKNININYEDFGFHKPYGSKYDVNTIKTNGLDVDVREFIIARLKAYKAKKKESSSRYDNIRYIEPIHNRITYSGTTNRVRIHSLAYSELASLAREKDAAELYLDSKIEGLWDWLDSRKIPLDLPLIDSSVKADIEHIFPRLETVEWCVDEYEKLNDYDDYRSRIAQFIHECNSSSRNLHVSSNDYCLDDWSEWYLELIEKIEDVLRAKRLYNALSKEFLFLVRVIKKGLRNLRQLFHKQHSFHFKNLDDYHDTILNLNLIG